MKRTSIRAMVVTGLLVAMLAAGLVEPVAAQPRVSQTRAEPSPAKPEGEMRWALYVTLAPHGSTPPRCRDRSRRSGCSTRCTTRS